MLYHAFFCLRPPACFLITQTKLNALAHYALSHALLRSTLNYQAKCARRAFFFFLFARPRAKPLKRHALNSPVCALPHYQSRAKSICLLRVFFIILNFAWILKIFINFFAVFLCAVLFLKFAFF